MPFIWRSVDREPLSRLQSLQMIPFRKETGQPEEMCLEARAWNRQVPMLIVAARYGTVRMLTVVACCGTVRMPLHPHFPKCLQQMEKKKQENKMRRDQLNDQYLELLEKQRLYFKTVKEFKEVRGCGPKPNARPTQLKVTLSLALGPGRCRCQEGVCCKSGRT